jgi:hypothetical protein
MTRLPATFQSRDREKRKEIVKKFGGTEESERAVELSLKWLADNQHPDGYWNASGFGSGKVKIRPEIKVDDPNRAVEENDADRHFTGLRADTGVTGLAVLAFLAAGYTPDDGQYAETMSRAVNWLARQQRSDGFLGGSAKYYARHYCHAMATYALAETYAISLSDGIGGHRRLKEPVTKAVGYILKMQNPSDGGWRYRKGLKSDMSMFGWQLMALKTAEISGIAVPKSAKDGMIEFLKNRSLGKRKGLAAYREGEQPSRVMTAEALFCKQMLGINRDNPASLEAVEYLLDNLPKRSELNLYYWYYGTLAMFQYGGDSWKQWNPAFRDALRDEQVQSGPNIGSWDPKGPWGPYGGRVYATAVSTLCLQVYTRYLRLYGTDGALDD